MAYDVHPTPTSLCLPLAWLWLLCALCVLCDKTKATTSPHIVHGFSPIVSSSSWCFANLFSLPDGNYYYYYLLQDYTFQSVRVCCSVHACEMRIAKSSPNGPYRTKIWRNRNARCDWLYHHNASHHITELEINTNVNLYFLHFRPIILHSVHHAFDSQKKIHK